MESKPIELTVVDIKTKERLLTKESLDTPLSGLREELAEQWPNFSYVKIGTNEEVPILKGQEKKFTLRDIFNPDKKQIYISSGVVEKKKDSATERNEQYAKNMLDKAKIQGLIKELDEFSKLRKEQAEKLTEASKKKLESLSKELKEFNIDIPVENFENFKKDAAEALKNIMEDTQEIAKSLQSSTDLTEKDLLKKFAKICHSKKKLTDQMFQCIVDIENSEFIVDRGTELLKQTQVHQFSRQSAEDIRKRIDSSIVAGQINLGIIGAGFAGTAGLDAKKTTKEQSADSSQTQTEKVTTIYAALNVNRSFKFAQADIKIKEPIRKEYWDLFDAFQEAIQKKLDLPKKQIERFINNYGYFVEVGTYNFGGYYFLQNEVVFQSKVTGSVAEKLATDALNASLKAGGFIGSALVAGTASFNKQGQSASMDKNKTSSAKGSCSTNVTSYPKIKSKPLWEKMSVLRLDAATLLNTTYNKYVPITQVMRNRHNIIDRCRKFENDNNSTLDSFDFIFDKVAQELRGELKKSEQSEYHIVLIGNTGAGKSYFGNQLVGENLNYPFAPSNKVASATFQVHRHKFVFGPQNFIIYDTPGLNDNRQDKAPDVQLLLASVVNSNYKEEKKYKYVNCFMFVVMVHYRVEFKDSLSKLLDIYGEGLMDSIIIVLNMSPEFRNNNPDLNKVIEECGDFAYIKKNWKNFSFENQVYFNYKFEGNMGIDLELNNYRSHRLRLLGKVPMLSRYDSNHYQEYLKKLKAREVNEKRQQDTNNEVARKIKENEAALKRNTEDFFNKLGCFSLKHTESKTYICYGWIGFFNKGFTFGPNLQKLFFKNQYVDYESGQYSGDLGTQYWPEIRMATDGQEAVGYRKPSLHTIQTVTLTFVGGKKEMAAFTTKGYVAKVKVSILGRELKYRNGHLVRVAAGSGDAFELWC